MNENRLTILTLTGVMCGVIIGVILKNYSNRQWSERDIMYFQFPGEIFLRIINCLVLPLIISSVVSASCYLSKSGSIGLKAFYYYCTTTSLGIILAVTLVQTIKPGEFYVNRNTTVSNHIKKSVTADAFLDLLRNLFTDNLIKASLSQTQITSPLNSTNDENINSWEIHHRDNDGTNVLGIVGFCLVLGIAIGHLEEKGKPLNDFFKSLSDTVMLMMDWVIMIVPAAVLFLIPGKILEAENITLMISNLGLYVLVVFAGLFIHSLIVLPLLYFICTRKSPYSLLLKTGPAIITALGTSSSTATVPMTIKCLNRIGVNPKVSQFIAPIGATINMDGIALYETIGALFIIQQRGLDFSLMQIISIAITCTVSCIGAAGLPSGGYVMLIVVLESIGIPAEDIDTNIPDNKTPAAK
ncbi:Similar to SLC1A1: Excitatory amino acid transporter 3 (Oryctolagus cuniculus) [Cotesia congregata]|uniref:Amino acid transporter n=1 Tax=Cotesia congregata TaxID=51543 RepID=A0A8J2HIF5_COTCN|nr:Similar to SLC1A1: Excitatory amino acid transporter 3 (Oryctolagus cuniculus) [Cotesia congregata]